LKKLTAGIFSAVILSSLLVVFAFTSIGTPTTGLEITETEVPNTDEQKRVNAELASMGLIPIDGKWWTPEALKIKNFQAQEGIQVPFQFGGWLTVEHYSISGALLSIQTIHNRVPNEGEDWIIQQTFKEGNAGETLDTDQIASICVTAEGGFVDTLETRTAVNFDSADALASNNCIADAAVSSTSQTAIIGALTFDAPTHVPASTTITGIGICQGSGTTPFAQCQDAQGAGAGILYSLINISDVTLESAETVDITYTMDYSSAGS